LQVPLLVLALALLVGILIQVFAATIHMFKLSNSHFTGIALAMLVLTYPAQAFFEPDYSIYKTQYETKTVSAADLIKHPHKRIFIIERSLLKNNVPIKGMMEAYGLDGRLQRQKYKGKGELINGETLITFTGNIFVKQSSFFESLFARADDRVCLLEAQINNKKYIVYPRMTNDVYNFKCEELN
jgi:hypothetical protein